MSLLTGAVATGRGSHPFHSLADAVRKTRKIRAVEDGSAVGAPTTTRQSEANREATGDIAEGVEGQALHSLYAL